VAIQIAAGNYDMGFCGLDWVFEHTIKYRAAKIHVLNRLGLDRKGLYLCSGIDGDIRSVDNLHRIQDFVTIVSEYPNLAENFAMTERLRKFKVFSAWGSVEAYPPEHADVVLLALDDGNKLPQIGLQNLVGGDCYLGSDLCLVVNRQSFLEKNLSPVVQFFSKMESRDDPRS
jgi:ATP phosphoribosyltransferase